MDGQHPDSKVQPAALSVSRNWTQRLPEKGSSKDTRLAGMSLPVCDVEPALPGSEPQLPHLDLPLACLLAVL